MLIRRANSTDLGHVLNLLSASDLTTEGLVEDAALTLVAEDANGIIGCAAIETSGSDALLRSVAVSASSRNTGLGTRLVDRIEDEARRLGIQKLFLLTTTAEKFFDKLGYRIIDRQAVPDVVRNSAEFCTCSSAGATAMERIL